MSARSRPDPSRLGIALDGGTLVAVTGDAGARAVSVPVDLGNAADPGRALEAAFADLAARIGVTMGRTEGLHVNIALLPPFADTRIVELPPLRWREVEAVIRRDAARHFVGGAGARTIAIAPAGAHETGREAATVIAAAAPVALVEAVRAAAQTIGWTVDAVVPAHDAWLAESREGPAGGTNLRAVVVTHGETVIVMARSGPRVTSVRQLPALMLDEIVAACGPTAGDALVIAEPGNGAALEHALAAGGWVMRANGRSAPETAAACAHRATMRFVPPSVVAERWQRSRRLARRMAVAAAALVILAGALELWGTQRELESLTRRRAAIRSEVAPLIATRDSIRALEERTGAIRQLEADAPRWTRALFDLALLLPVDAHITALRTRGDTLVIEASAARAGEAMQALRRAGSLSDLRLEGVVDRDLADGSTTVERFRLSARLRAPLQAPSDATPAAARGSSDDDARAAQPIVRPLVRMRP